MKIIKRFKPLLLLLLLAGYLVITLVRVSRAADYDISCDASDCDSSGLAMFNENSVAPGQSVSKTFEIKNNHNETLNMDMIATKNIGTDDEFLDVVDVTVDEIGFGNRFIGSLTQFFDDPSIDLGSLNDGKTKQVMITMALQDVNNDFQGKKANFDIPIHINVQSPAEDGGDGGIGGAAAPAVAGATTTTIPGIFGGMVAGLTEAVLGEATPSGEIGEESIPSLYEKVKGIASIWWWWPLVIQLVLSLIYTYFVKKTKKWPQTWWLIILVLVVISQIAHHFIGCDLASSRWCLWYWLLNMIIVIFSFILKTL